MDVLSDVLRVIRLNGALFLNAEFREPWCVSAARGPELAQVLAQPHDHMAVCHLIVEGRCWARFTEDEPLELVAGDVLVLPHGEAHLLGSGMNHGPLAAKDAVQLKLPDLGKVRYGGHGASTEIVCGWFAYERDVAQPMMAPLPRMFRTCIRTRPSGVWLEESVRYAVREASSGTPGSSAISDKLAELLFVEALRGFVEALPPQPTSWLAGLRDPLVGRCIALLHQRPERDWTVAALARALSVSRTVLAERFVMLTGIPPIQYLTQWRLALAAHLLRRGRLGIARVAEQVGYDSEAAFCRAFKREYGVPPGQWRRKRLTAA